MIHNLENTAPFHDDDPLSPICSIAMPVVVELSDWDMHVVGTATLVAGHLAITARHVLEFVLREFGSKHVGDKKLEVNYAIRLYQVLPGPVYRIWNVHQAWVCPSDIVVMQLGLFKTSAPNQDLSWVQPILRGLPPPVGSTVIAFGYRESKVNVTTGENGQPHIDLNGRPTSSFGKVIQIFPDGRDRVLLPFPCFEIEARLDPGMSGGLVVDDVGHVCGLICASMATSDGSQPPVGYIVSLWPMLRTVISANRAGAHPRDVEYEMINLAVDRIIYVIDLPEVVEKYFSDRITLRQL